MLLTSAVFVPPAAALPRVVIAFLPGPAPQVKPPLIERLAANDDLALGFMSSIMGSYTPEQALLDMSAGSRTWTSLYEGELETPMRLERTGTGGRISGWVIARERADTPPADVVPGTLAQAAKGSELIAYVGFEGRANREAIIAADRAGRVSLVSLVSRRAVAAEVTGLWRSAALIVARLPSGRDGRAALGRILRARRPGDLVLAIQDPTGVARRLLAVGAAGLPGEGNDVRSVSSRSDGLVVSTDLVPMVLERLKVPIPDHVAGEPIRASGTRSAKQLETLRNRLAEVGRRRWTVILLGLVGASLLAAAVAVTAGGGAGRVARATFLAAMWLPAVLLLTGALAPSRAGETLLVAILTGGLGLASDRVLSWPRAIVLPAAVAVGSCLLDLAFGSALTQRSLLGPNPLLGARFFGVGNELEVVLAVTGLLGIGAAVAASSAEVQRRAFVIGGLALAFALSWGRLGADVGASIMLAAGTAAAAVTAGGGTAGRRGAVIVLAAPLVGLAALALVDMATGGDAHFTRSVLRAGGFGELADIAQRRLELSYRGLGRGLIGVLALVAAVALVWGVRRRGWVLARLGSAPGLRAAAWGALVAVVAGALSNDSGPLMLLIGTSYLALAVGYFRAAPNT